MILTLITDGGKWTAGGEVVCHALGFHTRARPHRVHLAASRTFKVRGRLGRDTSVLGQSWLAGSLLKGTCAWPNTARVYSPGRVPFCTVIGSDNSVWSLPNAAL